jgi:hypothetical protein
MLVGIVAVGGKILEGGETRHIPPRFPKIEVSISRIRDRERQWNTVIGSRR